MMNFFRGLYRLLLLVAQLLMLTFTVVAAVCKCAGSIPSGSRGFADEALTSGQRASRASRARYEVPRAHVVTSPEGEPAAHLSRHYAQLDERARSAFTRDPELKSVHQFYLSKTGDTVEMRANNWEAVAGVQPPKIKEFTDLHKSIYRLYNCKFYCEESKARRVIYIDANILRDPSFKLSSLRPDEEIKIVEPGGQVLPTQWTADFFGHKSLHVETIPNIVGPVRELSLAYGLRARRFSKAEASILSLIENTDVERELGKTGLKAVPFADAVTNLEETFKARAGRTMFVLGHVEGESFVTRVDGVKTAEIALADLKAKAAKYDISLFTLGCEIGRGGTFGPREVIYAEEVLDRLAGALNADNFYDLFRLFAADQPGKRRLTLHMSESDIGPRGNFVTMRSDPLDSEDVAAKATLGASVVIVIALYAKWSPVETEEQKAVEPPSLLSRLLEWLKFILLSTAQILLFVVPGYLIVRRVSRWWNRREEQKYRELAADAVQGANSGRSAGYDFEPVFAAVREYCLPLSLLVSLSITVLMLLCLLVHAIAPSVVGDAWMKSSAVFTLWCWVGTLFCLMLSALDFEERPGISVFVVTLLIACPILAVIVSLVAPGALW